MNCSNGGHNSKIFATAPAFTTAATFSTWNSIQKGAFILQKAAKQVRATNVKRILLLFPDFFSYSTSITYLHESWMCHYKK